jgi:hypothetical protein
MLPAAFALPLQTAKQFLLEVKMRSIGLAGSLVALFIAAPLAAQGKHQESKNKVPPGQRPPAGMCRIWIDGVPPGQQPAPTDCPTAVATKPANATVIWGKDTAFPGRGKDSLKVERRRADGDKEKSKVKHRDRDDDDAMDDDRDDDDKDNRANTGTSRFPVITGAIPNGSQTLSRKSKGKGRGRD